MSQNTSPPTRILCGISVPSTPLITAALALAKSKIDDQTFNHVVRSWLFGSYIASQIPELKDIDTELHAVCAILHDLGWSTLDDGIVSKDKRFEVDGANACRTFIISETENDGEKWDTHRLQLAWDSIALHTTPSISLYKEPEVRACSLGIVMDFTGPRDMIPKDVWDGIVAGYPRTGFKDAVTEALCGLCRRKPETTYDNFVGNFGVRFLSGEGYSLVGKRMIDIIEALEQ